MEKPGTSSESELLEYLPLNDLETSSNEEEERRAVRRSNTSANAKKPKLKVEFNTLPQGYERQLSDYDIELLSSRAHDIGRANWSGGWQNTILKRRRKGYNPTSEEDEVTEITEAMGDDERLMSDDVDGEVLRRDALRELTKSLKVRREIKQNLTNKRSSLRSTQRNVTCYNAFKYSLSYKWFKLKLRVSDTLHDYSLWHKDLKDIEGIYGSSIGSYFSFLRYLFLLNTFVSFIIVGFLIVPQQLYNHYYTVENTQNDTSVQNLTASAEVPEIDNDVKFGAMDIFTGAGWFSHTLLYYGGYSFTGLFILFNSNAKYDMTPAYFFTVLACFIIYLLVLLHQIFTLYKLNYVDTEEDVNVTFVEKVFSGWDFNITDEAAAKIKHRSIYNELIEMLQEFHHEEEVAGFFDRIKRKFITYVAWGFSLGFLMVLGFCLFVLLRDGLKDFSTEEYEYWRSSFELLVYPIIVTLVMVIIPAVFEAIARFEEYKKPRHELYSTLVRVTLLQVTMLTVLLTFWYFNSPGLNQEFNSKNIYNNESVEHKNQSVDCWETALGEEVYRLVFVDFLVILVNVLIFDTSKRRLVESGRADKSYLQFSLPRNILHIIYNQTLLWAGMFFCPLLPLIISIKFLIIFYLQKFNVTKNLEPMDRPFRASQTKTLYYTLMLFSFILSFLNFVFILIKGYSSQTCGPFQKYDHYGKFLVVGNSQQFLVQIFSWILKPNAMLLVIAILSVILYCVKNVAEGRAELVSVLRKQLEVELKDRVFLQRWIEKVKKGEYVPGSPRNFPSSAMSFEIEEDSRLLTRKTSFVFSRSQEDSEEPSAF